MGKIIKFPFKKSAISIQKEPSANKPSLDEHFCNISQQSHKHLRQGNLGLYACDVYSLSEINRKEKQYDKQLHSLSIAAYIHLSGISTLEEYSYWKDGDFSLAEPQPILPPAVIRSLKLCIKRCNMSIEQYKEFFLEIVDTTLTPTHVFGVNGTLEIVCTYLDGNTEKADKMVNNGAKKFIHEHSTM